MTYISIFDDSKDPRDIATVTVFKQTADVDVATGQQSDNRRRITALADIVDATSMCQGVADCVESYTECLEGNFIQLPLASLKMKSSLSVLYRSSVVECDSGRG